jgi:excisionase family DNA binding protein
MENLQQIDQSENHLQPLLAIDEVALLLHISRSFAYNLVMSGKLPVIKIGRSRRVRPADLDQFISSNRFGENIR